MRRPFDTSAGPEELRFYTSLASPYGFLAAPRVIELPGRFDVSLSIRVVEPPTLTEAQRKLRAVDVRREARRLGIRLAPFRGRGASALHTATSVLHLARPAQAAGELLVRLGAALWTEGRDLTGPEALAPMCREVGIDWHSIAAELDHFDLASVLAEHRRELEAAGHWGVPTLVFRGEPFFGQDRIEDCELAMAAAGRSVPRGHLSARIRR